MRSQVEGSTRRVWIRNEVTSKQVHDCILLYDPYAIFGWSLYYCWVFFPPPFSGGYATRTLTLVGYQNIRSLQNPRLVQGVTQASENPHPFRMIAVFASLRP